MKIDFGDWTPDLAAIVVPGVTVAKNVIPYPEGYAQIREPAAKMAALNAKAINGFWAQDSAATSQIFVATGTEIFKRDSTNNWDDVTRTGSDYTATDDWQFARWGNTVVACSKANATQTIDMTSGTNFAALTGAPQASTVAVVRDFMVFGDTTESAVSYITRVRWSGFNNNATYGSSLATQADYQDLAGDGGRVQKIVGGSVGIIFCERSIWTMTYQGPPVIFRFDEVDPGRGTPAKNSVCNAGNLIFFYSHDGFYTFSLGQGSTPIGLGKVNQWFASESDPTRLDEMRGAVDRTKNLVIWSFASNSAGTNCDRLIMYHWPTGKWSYAEVTCETIFEAVALDYNLDTLDTILPGGIDTDSIAVDSTAFVGGSLLVSVFNSSHEYCALDGDPLTATIESGEFGPGPKLWISRVRPIADQAITVTGQIGSRNRQTDNYAWSAVKSQNAIGVIPFRRNGRYHRVRLMLADGFSRATGAEIDVIQGGAK